MLSTTFTLSVSTSILSRMAIPVPMYTAMGSDLGFSKCTDTRLDVVTCTRASATATGDQLLVDSSTSHVPLLTDSSTPAMTSTSLYGGISTFCTIHTLLLSLVNFLGGYCRGIECSCLVRWRILFPKLIEAPCAFRKLRPRIALCTSGLNTATFAVVSLSPNLTLTWVLPWIISGDLSAPISWSSDQLINLWGCSAVIRTQVSSHSSKPVSSKKMSRCHWHFRSPCSLLKVLLGKRKPYVYIFEPYLSDPLVLGSRRWGLVVFQQKKVIIFLAISSHVAWLLTIETFRLMFMDNRRYTLVVSRLR